VISIDGFECAGHPGEDDIPSWSWFLRRQISLLYRLWPVAVLLMVVVWSQHWLWVQRASIWAHAFVRLRKLNPIQTSNSFMSTMMKGRHLLYRRSLNTARVAKKCSIWAGENEWWVWSLNRFVPMSVV
jgi:hypothetical protein